MRAKGGPSKSKPRASQDYELIAAIATGDASADDIARQLRGMGIDRIEDVIAYIREGTKQRGKLAHSTPDLVDLKRFSAERKPAPRRKAVQRVPEVPVIVGGTTYDPKDLRRFDGTELHFVATPGSRSLRALTDRSVMQKWWEYTYIRALALKTPADILDAIHLTPAEVSDGPPVYGGVTPQGPKPPMPVPTPPMPEPQREPGAPRSDGYVRYAEHDNLGGSELTHPGGRGYHDLTKVSSGLFGWGSNWNDRISSLEVWNLSICVLHEDIYWGGQSLSLPVSFVSQPYGPVGYSHRREDRLAAFSWNDRASSVEGW